MDEYDSFDHIILVTWEILAGVIFVSLIIGQNEIARICTFPLLFTIGYFFVRRKLKKKSRSLKKLLERGGIKGKYL